MMRIQPEKRANEHEQNATCCYLTNNNISQTIQVYRKDLLAFPFFFFPPGDLALRNQQHFGLATQAFKYHSYLYL